MKVWNRNLSTYTYIYIYNIYATHLNYHAHNDSLPHHNCQVSYKFSISDSQLLAFQIHKQTKQTVGSISSSSYNLGGCRSCSLGRSNARTASSRRSGFSIIFRFWWLWWFGLHMGRRIVLQLQKNMTHSWEISWLPGFGPLDHNYRRILLFVLLPLFLYCHHLMGDKLSNCLPVILLCFGMELLPICQK